MNTQAAQPNSPVLPTEPRAPRTIAVVSASVRTERMGPAVADWVVEGLHRTEGAKVDLIDLAEIALPDDSHLVPGGGEVRSEVAERIEAAEAFVFVTPEYNHSFPASLKRLIDWHYTEWMFKPAALVGYGAQGGAFAIQQLRAVLAELNVVTARRITGVRAPWEHLDEAGRHRPGAAVERGLDASLAELCWWADVLTPARAERPFVG